MAAVVPKPLPPAALRRFELPALAAAGWTAYGDRPPAGLMREAAPREGTAFSTAGACAWSTSTPRSSRRSPS